MKLLQFSAGSSNSGKTVTSMIITRGLKNLGYDVQGFKCGPDFIDTKYLALAAGKEPANLDKFLMGETGLKKSLSLSRADIGILEGAMGYFDGIGTTWEASAYDIAKTLDIKTVLIYHPQGEMFTIIPKLKGMIEYSEERIVGVIFSKTSQKMYEMLKDLVEENLGILALGYVEKNDNLVLESRKLGLMLPDELSQLDENLNEAVKKSYNTINYSGLLDIMISIDLKDVSEEIYLKPRLTIARDEAFSFLYGENLKLFHKYFQVSFFSPIHDINLPECDLVFIPGGYPENHLLELTINKSMRNSIEDYVEKGGYLYSESGGTIYMADTIESVPMCGIISGNAVMKNRLQNFGYVKIKTLEESILGIAGTEVNAHEFHYSTLEKEVDGIFMVEKARGSDPWVGGYKVKNALMSFQHINFCGNEHLLKNMAKIVGGQNVYK